MPAGLHTSLTTTQTLQGRAELVSATHHPSAAHGGQRRCVSQAVPRVCRCHDVLQWQLMLDSRGSNRLGLLLLDDRKSPEPMDYRPSRGHQSISISISISWKTPMPALQKVQCHKTPLPALPKKPNAGARGKVAAHSMHTLVSETRVCIEWAATKKYSPEKTIES